MKDHVMFLKLAESDLKVAKCLLEKKLYHQSVSHMQQSAEKALKSVGFWTKAIDRTDARNSISHQALKVLPRIQKGLSESFEKLTPFLEELVKSGCIEREQIDEMRAAIDLIAKESSTSVSKLVEVSSNSELALAISLSKGALQTLVDSIDKEREELNDLKRERLAQPRVDEQTIRRWLENFPQQSSVNPDEVSRLREKAKSITSEEIQEKADKQADRDRERAEVQFRLALSFSSLIVLNIAFSTPHAFIPRYAEYKVRSQAATATDKFRTVDPFELYTEKMALVEMLPLFMKVAGETYAMLEGIYAREPR